MAQSFELAIECGPDEQAARSMGKFFDGYGIQVDGLNGEISSHCRVACWQDAEKNWWCSAFPSHVSLGMDDNTIQSQSEILQVTNGLYDRLKSAPPFRYAVCGFEAYLFGTYSELLREKGANHKPFDGLVLNRVLWEEIGRPSFYEPFRSDACWIPIS